MSRTVLQRFPAGGPRGSWPAEEFASARRDEGLPAEVVMDLESDTFLVVVRQRAAETARPVVGAVVRAGAGTAVRI
ncbi:hypothetical protein M5362_11980 [Streptomyces sp. Je 1-79]|uniref:hypothetical protein n=1 Tax=Streptomyces sp. Je 1-79 TaxID=2943847 RepID=UPI0021A5E580|nr:hypothetical protein [Streptomyces sp. Je 1-79]MCT4353846.1 hypothetical protein [Streptomyces sp. Je 1-79]